MTATVSDLDAVGGWEFARPTFTPRVGDADVVGFWDRSAAGLDMRIIPHPAVTIVFDFGAHPLHVHGSTGRQVLGGLLAGLSPSMARIRSSRVECIEVRLSPLSAYSVLGVSPVDLDNLIVDLEDLWGRPVGRVRE